MYTLIVPNPADGIKKMASKIISQQKRIQVNYSSLKNQVQIIYCQIPK